MSFSRECILLEFYESSFLTRATPKLGLTSSGFRLFGFRVFRPRDTSEDLQQRRLWYSQAMEYKARQGTYRASTEYKAKRREARRLWRARNRDKWLATRRASRRRGAQRRLIAKGPDSV